MSSTQYVCDTSQSSLFDAYITSCNECMGPDTYLCIWVSALRPFSRAPLSQATLQFLHVAQLVSITEGYECQEFNGVFMLAFSDVSAAVHFALILQQLLMVADWPKKAMRLARMQQQSDSRRQVRLRKACSCATFNPSSRHWQCHVRHARRVGLCSVTGRGDFLCGRGCKADAQRA